MNGLIPAVLAISFLIGSIPFGLLIARIYKVKNLRGQGSGNIGATNVSRVLGFWPAGAATFFLDFLKGVLPVLVLMIPGFRGWWSDSLHGPEITQSFVWATALFSVLGHCYSPWLRFNGGKGVATAFGAILVLSPVAAGVAIAAFGLTFYGTRIGSLSSITGVLVAVIAHLVFEPAGLHLWFGAALVFVILIRHQSNLDALLEDKENRFA